MKVTLKLRSARTVNGATQATWPGCDFDPMTGLVFVPDRRPTRPAGSGSYIHIGDGVVETEREPVAEKKAKDPKAA